jgi:excisionase family DNA binding protein
MNAGTSSAALAEMKLNTPIAYTIAEACDASRAGRTTLYKAIRSGKLRALKHGRRTIILRSDLLHWLESMPPVAPTDNRRKGLRS